MFSHANNKPGEQHLWHGEQSRVQSGLCQVPGLEKLRPVPVSLRSPTSLHGAAPDTSPRTWSQCWGRGPSAGDVVPVLGMWSQCQGCGPSARVAFPVPGTCSRQGPAAGSTVQGPHELQQPVLYGREDSQQRAVTLRDRQQQIPARGTRCHGPLFSIKDARDALAANISF